MTTSTDVTNLKLGRNLPFALKENLFFVCDRTGDVTLLPVRDGSHPSPPNLTDSKFVKSHRQCPSSWWQPGVNRASDHTWNRQTKRKSGSGKCTEASKWAARTFPEGLDFWGVVEEAGAANAGIQEGTRQQDWNLQDSDRSVCPRCV